MLQLTDLYLLLLALTRLDLPLLAVCLVTDYFELIFWAAPYFEPLSAAWALKAVWMVVTGKGFWNPRTLSARRLSEAVRRLVWALPLTPVLRRWHPCPCAAALCALLVKAAAVHALLRGVDRTFGRGAVGGMQPRVTVVPSRDADPVAPPSVRSSGSTSAAGQQHAPNELRRDPRSAGRQRGRRQS